MKYYDFEVGNTNYQLRLTMRTIMKLEKKIGMNPLAIFSKGEVPTLTVMLDVFYHSLLSTNPNMTANDAYDLFDQWLDEGHSLVDFVPIILDIYKVSGLINEEENDAKN